MAGTLVRKHFVDAVAEAIFDVFANADADAPWEKQIYLPQRSYFFATRTTVLQNFSWICNLSAHGSLLKAVPGFQ